MWNPFRFLWKHRNAELEAARSLVVAAAELYIEAATGNPAAVVTGGYTDLAVAYRALENAVKIHKIHEAATKTGA